MRDYVEWHREYDDPDSGLSWRLLQVQRHIRTALAPSLGPRRILSLCAGDGRDILDILAAEPSRTDVSTTLVELDSQIAEQARQRTRRDGIGHVTVLTADAAIPATYATAFPADLVLLVGIFGNISDADLQRTIEFAPQLCRPGATVVWSRARRGSDRDAEVRAWFTEAGFAELDHATRESGSRPTIGAVRYDGASRPFTTSGPLFTFWR